MLNDLPVLDILKVVFTVTGAGITAYITARLSRRSQAESNRVEEANGIVERYNKLTADVVAEKTTAVSENKYLRGQISLWRRYTQALRGQIYRLGGEPMEADEKLDM